MHLVVGLGNPGPRYSGTRHNAGFRVVEALSRRLHSGVQFGMLRSICAKADYRGESIILAQPLTYMNLSGRAVAELLKRYPVKEDRLLLIHDDLDLPLGVLRIKKGGGSAGHRGVESVIAHLGTADFARLRFGVGRPPDDMEASLYVLDTFDPGEGKLLAETVDRAVQAVLTWVESGLERAASCYNRKRELP